MRNPPPPKRWFLSLIEGVGYRLFGLFDCCLLFYFFQNVYSGSRKPRTSGNLLTKWVDSFHIRMKSSQREMFTLSSKYCLFNSALASFPYLLQLLSIEDWWFFPLLSLNCSSIINSSRQSSIEIRHLFLNQMSLVKKSCLNAMLSNFLYIIWAE